MEGTIAAISTARVPGGIGIIRVCGKDAINISDRVFRGKRCLSELSGYNAAYGNAVDKDGEVIDEVIVLVFRSPKSYTGEDMVEFSCHGGIYTTDRLLHAVLDAGAVLAQPGEFTKTAFLNGKMDLLQAESVMKIISASGEKSAREAIAGQTGVLSKRIYQIRESLVDISAHLAAWADFPEEDVPQVKQEVLLKELSDSEAQIQDMISGYEKGKIIREGVTAAIVGKTNVGKSTLMNLLCAQESSIVTQIAGTTRDVIENTAFLDGILLRLADTAGIRGSDDEVEVIGIAKSWEKVAASQLILAVFDSSRQLDDNDYEIIRRTDKKRTIAIINKSDLKTVADVEKIKNKFKYTLYISASNGEGIEELGKLVTRILDTKEFDPAAGNLYTDRQLEDAKDAASHIREAKQTLVGGMTLDAVTVCVEEGLRALYRLTGEEVSELITDAVFSQFCVGK